VLVGLLVLLLLVLLLLVLLLLLQGLLKWGLWMHGLLEPLGMQLDLQLGLLELMECCCSWCCSGIGHQVQPLSLY
jgi:hypothetical protein